MKYYYVFLDESGDFASDPGLPAHMNGSLVGGFFYRRDDIPQGMDRLSEHANKIIGEDIHATELTPGEKGPKTLEVFKGLAEFPVTFTVFENDRKRKIIDSTQTYLTVVTEGVIGLLKKLVTYEMEPVDIQVTVGFRKDTTAEVTNSRTEGYISLAEYKKRIDEKFAVEKAKLVNDLFRSSVVSVRLSDDKADPLLILCDYICNFRYTRGAKAFRGYREELEKFYDDGYIFPLFNTEEDEHVIRMVQDGFYADALFESCAGMLSEKNSDLVRESFIKLRPKQIDRQLDSLADYIGDLIIFRQSEKLVTAVLDGVDGLCGLLDENSIPHERFRMDVQLYRLAWLNNTGRLDEMESIFDAVESDVAAYTIRTLDVGYLLIYTTRRAVYLLDRRRYEQCCLLCENMELLLQLIEDAVRNNDCMKLEGEVRSENMGKILGTKLQALIPLCYLGKRTYEDARDVSDRAMEQFTYRFDLMRQYQYRAELEAVCGHFGEALVWLEKSFDGEGWSDRIGKRERSIFDIYNLLFAAAFSGREDPAGSVAIANRIYENCRKDIDANTPMRPVCNLLMGYVFAGDSRYRDRGMSLLDREKRYLEEGGNTGGENAFVYRAIIDIIEGREGLGALFICPDGKEQHV